MVCLAAGRVFPGCHDTKRPWFVEVCLRSLSFRLSGFFSPSPFLLRRSMVFALVFSSNLFLKAVFVGLMESTSLWVGILVEVRLPTAGSPQTPRKRDPHWEFVVVVVVLLNPRYLGLSVSKTCMHKMKTSRPSLKIVLTMPTGPFTLKMVSSSKGTDCVFLNVGLGSF